MPDPNPQAEWAGPSKIAAWLAGLIAAFLVKPPDLQYYGDGADVWLHLSQFVLAILIGIFFMNVKAEPGLAWRWRLWAIGLLLLGLILFALFEVLRPQWSCLYRETRVIAAASLTDNAADYLDKHPSATCDRLIQAARGFTEKVWPMHELVTRYVILSALYTLAFLSFAAAVMSMIEFVRARRQAGA